MIDQLIYDTKTIIEYHHGSNEFAKGKQHINGIESFGSFTKLAKFNGIKSEKFPLLKGS